MSLPDRRYDLAGHLLAAAIEEADHTAQPVRTILNRRAYHLGEELGQTARTTSDTESHAETVLGLLEERGFEPRTHDGQVLLGNCPFRTLARQHTQLVCGMNLSLIDGLLHGLGHTQLDARLDPARDRCCVRLQPAQA